MKRLILLAAILFMQIATFAQAPTTRVNSDKVKMYRQPGLGAEVMRTLTTEDVLVVMRKVNSQWSLVQINGEGGYVLNSYLKEKKNKKATATKAERGTPSAANF